jgi:hypothetical protein
VIAETLQQVRQLRPLRAAVIAETLQQVRQLRPLRTAGTVLAAWQSGKSRLFGRQGALFLITL